MSRQARLLLVATLIAGLVAVPQAAYAAIRITKIHFDPPGEDSLPEPNSDLNKERVVVCNTGSGRRSLSRWKLVDRGPDHRYSFPRGFKLRAGRCVDVHTGRGRDGTRHLYLDLDGYVWNNEGDRATLKNRSGRTKDRCTYSGGSSPADC